MIQVLGLSRRQVRGVRRKARLIIRSMLLHALVLALMVLGLCARLVESSNTQLASTGQVPLRVASTPHAPRTGSPTYAEQR